jgi:hypothetical protein
MAFTVSGQSNRLWSIALAALFALGAGFEAARADEFSVYNVNRPVDLGNPGERPKKDVYVNVGRSHGVRPGTVLIVSRKVSTYDAVSQKLYKDVSFPFAKVKVIHAEDRASIARVSELLPADQVPSISPREVMVGDIVRVSE